MMGKDVEEVSASLVREYLSRKGLKKTIACMDEELPRTQFSINNRSDLRTILHLEGLYKKNKAVEHPLKSFLEMIVKDRISDGYWEGDYQVPVEQTMNNSSQNTVVCVKTEEERMGNLLSSSSSTASEAQTSPENTQLSFAALPECENSVFQSSHSHGGSFAALKKSVPPEKKVMDADNLKNRSSRLRRGIMAGPISSSSQENNRRRPTRKTPLFVTTAVEDCRQTSNWTNELSVTDEKGNVSAFNEEDSGTFSNSHEGKKDHKRPEKMSQAKHLINRSTPSPKLDELHELEMVLDDIENEEGLSGVPNKIRPELPLERTPIDQTTAIALKEILFGSPMACFTDEWKQQNFSFSDTPGLKYGFVQKKGGPCGVLAAVQACVLQKLLFEESSTSSLDQKLEQSKNLRTKCLCLALGDVLWRAGNMKRATVAINTGRSMFTPIGRYKTDGVLEMMSYVTVETLDDLAFVLEQNIRQFESGPFGCILLTISAILSRTITTIQGDMDVPTSTLIGAHGYCTQELVNLLLCGCAVSNVFDHEMKLDSGNGNFTLLKGIKTPSNIGLLSLFEYYNICKVGSHLKNPKFPIWLVCSESHFSVLFGLSEDLAHSKEQEFDLFYYDGLANQQEPIRLTIYPHSAARTSHRDDTDADLIPPLELCIRTKWHNAEVCWNDTDPIL